MNIIITNIKNPKLFEDYLYSLGYYWYVGGKLSEKDISKLETYKNLHFRIYDDLIYGYGDEETYNIENNEGEFQSKIYEVITYSKFMRKHKLNKLK